MADRSNLVLFNRCRPRLSRHSTSKERPFRLLYI